MSLNKNRFRPHKCDNGPDKSYIQTSTRQTAAILITFSSWTRNSPQFVEYGSSTTYSQKPATCSYYEPVESSPHVYTASLRSLLILSLHLRPGLLVYRTQLHVQSLLSVPPYAHIIALYEKDYDSHYAIFASLQMMMICSQFLVTRQVMLWNSFSSDYSATTTTQWTGSHAYRQSYELTPPLSIPAKTLGSNTVCLHQILRHFKSFLVLLASQEDILTGTKASLDLVWKLIKYCKTEVRLCVRDSTTKPATGNICFQSELMNTENKWN
jgi:hypothetical protein